MDNKITITVAGKALSGKSSVMYHLEKLLKENGYNVELSFERHPDFSGENSFFFHQKMSEGFDERIESIKSNTKITLKEKQMASGKD